MTEEGSGRKINRAYSPRESIESLILAKVEVDAGCGDERGDESLDVSDSAPDHTRQLCFNDGQCIESSATSSPSSILLLYIKAPQPTLVDVDHAERVNQNDADNGLCIAMYLHSKSQPSFKPDLSR